MRAKKLIQREFRNDSEVARNILACYVCNVKGIPPSKFVYALHSETTTFQYFPLSEEMINNNVYSKVSQIGWLSFIIFLYLLSYLFVLPLLQAFSNVHHFTVLNRLPWLYKKLSSSIRSTCDNSLYELNTLI